MTTTPIVAITGASSGLGAEMAKWMAKKGWRPVLLARSVDKLELLQLEIKDHYNLHAPIYLLNVRDPIEVEAVFNRIHLETGGIDVLINNAGYGIFEYFHNTKYEDIEGMFETNVFGLMVCTKAVLAPMMERKRGHIINIASQAGKFATVKGSVYAASKHAVLGFTNSLRMEVSAQGIHVTSVNPGPIQTNFFKIADQSGQYQKNIKKWILQPEDIAKRVVQAIEKPVREINAPGWMAVGSKLYQLMPGFVERIGKKAFNQK